MNDIECVRKHLNWNKNSFWLLYEKYVDKIYKFVYLKVWDKNITEDIVSDVFFSSLNNINSFRLDSDSSFKSWIYKIAYNKVVDFYKLNSNNKSKWLWDYLDIWVEFNHWENIDNKDKLKEIFLYLNEVKTEYRDVIIYRIWDWLSFNQISEITWMSLDNCKKISSRILKDINNLFYTLLFILII